MSETSYFLGSVIVKDDLKTREQNYYFQRDFSKRNFPWMALFQ